MVEESNSEADNKEKSNSTKDNKLLNFFNDENDNTESNDKTDQNDTNNLENTTPTIIENMKGENGLEIICVNVCVRYEGTKC